MQVFHNATIRKKCAIIMPAYNEEAALPSVIAEWYEIVKNIDGMLIILNDGSKDNTLSVLKAELAKRPQMIVIDKPNAGHGITCLQGYRYCIEQGFEWVFQTDSDGQVKASEFMKAWALREQYPFIFGFRPKRGDGPLRWFISRVLRLVIFLTFNVNVRDANVPFRLMNVKKLTPYINWIPEHLFLANAYVAILLQGSQKKIHWITISFYPRSGGVPSVSLKKFSAIGLKVTKEFWRMRRAFKTARPHEARVNHVPLAGREKVVS